MKKILFFATTLSVLMASFVACGGDSPSSSSEPDVNSSAKEDVASSSSVILSSSSVIPSEVEGSNSSSSSSTKADPNSHQGDESSSSASQYVCDIYTLQDAVSCTCDEDRKGKLAYNHDSKVELVCTLDEYLNKWGWVTKKDEESSSSSDGSSSSVGGVSSSSVASSSSSASVVPSSSSAEESSSSVYVPFDHKEFFAAEWKVGKDRYKQFTDERNGRSYYYITITGRDTGFVHRSITVMAENLNIGDLVKGTKKQNDDTKIERYCYSNDTTNCDKYGGLYQWAEMMQLPSRCNTESCAKLIKKNHQGICPDGWRLLTYNDMYTIVHADSNKYGVEGIRSECGFNGYNTTGYSLVGAGENWDYQFTNMEKDANWFYPEEDETSSGLKALASGSFKTATTMMISKYAKTHGFSVRCVKLDE